MANESVTRLEEYFQCCLCNRSATSPKLLQCLHTFCAGCLERECSGNDVRCPICEMVTKSSVSSLQDNILVSNLQSCLKVQQQILANVKLDCTSCEGNNGAEFICPECDKLMCSNCLQVHNVLMADHTRYVQTLGTLRKLNSDEFLKILRRSKELSCSTHENQQISLYCSSCSMWLCVLCVLVEHRDHNCITVRKQITQQKSELRETLAAIQTNQAKFAESQSQLEQLVDKLNRDKYKLEDLIKARVSAALQKVREEESRLLSELQELHLSKTQKLQECLTSMENTLKRMAVSRDMVSQLLRYATEQEMLKLQGIIKSALSRLQKEKPMDVQVENTIIDFQECCVFPERMLGSLIITRMRPESSSDRNFQLPGCSIAAQCKEEVDETPKCSFNKRKCHTAEETQSSKKQCLQEEPSNSAEGDCTAGCSGSAQGAGLCIESVTSVAETDKEELMPVFLDTVVELIQIDSEDSN
ncbi:protein PML-like [Pristis pectinata]|uniref:protein PML-like n=1 Tax=Pristis pectinata TaxID=685728 RepID=UPI00223DFBCF|nr:protein PML-like [Pristis pectinata]